MSVETKRDAVVNASLFTEVSGFVTITVVVSESNNDSTLAFTVIAPALVMLRSFIVLASAVSIRSTVVGLASAVAATYAVKGFGRIFSMGGSQKW